MSEESGYDFPVIPLDSQSNMGSRRFNSLFFSKRSRHRSGRGMRRKSRRPLEERGREYCLGSSQCNRLAPGKLGRRVSIPLHFQCRTFGLPVTSPKYANSFPRLALGRSWLSDFLAKTLAKTGQASDFRIRHSGKGFKCRRKEAALRNTPGRILPGSRRPARAGGCERTGRGLTQGGERRGVSFSCG